METICKKLPELPNFIDSYMQILQKMTNEERQKLFIDLLCENKYDLAKHCIKYFDDLNFGMDDKTNPLISMCTKGYLDGVKFLLNYNVDINYLSKYGTTAIMFAFQCKHIDIVIFLYEKGALIEVGKKKMIEYASICSTKEEMYQYVKWMDYLTNKIKKMEENKEFNSW